MRASTARLTNSPVRLADLQFPQVNRLIHRTRLAFIHFDKSDVVRHHLVQMIVQAYDEHSQKVSI